MISGSKEQLQQGLEYTLLKPDCQQLVNFKNAIRTWGHFRRTICNKILFLNLEKMPQKRMECFRMLLAHLAWIKHQFLSGIRDSRKAGSLWGMIRGVEGVRKSIHQSWLAKGLGLGLLCWGFKGSSGRDSVGRGQHSSNRVSGISTRDNAPVHNSILVTDYLTKMSIKTVPHPPYSRDLASLWHLLIP